MSSTGDDNALYVAAREVLLDGFGALGPHQETVILVGAQAIYLHVGEADFAVAAFTSDADFVIDPQSLEPSPLLEEALVEAGFREGSQPGIWVTTREVNATPTLIGFDLLVPDSLGGAGSRAARLPPHSLKVARKARGLEGALVDHRLMEVASLPPAAPRSLRLRVAGPAALLVAKLHKLGERAREAPERLKPKDALDALRLLRGVETADLAEGMTRLRQASLSAEVTEQALTFLDALFGEPGGTGCGLAATALAGLEPAETVAASAQALALDLLEAVGPQDSKG